MEDNEILEMLKKMFEKTRQELVDRVSKLEQDIHQALSEVK